jgi:stalled ribosome rescue protein Dom34
MTKYVAVWIDHKEARVFHLRPGAIDAANVTTAQKHIHNKHPRTPEVAKQHPDDVQRYFQEVARSLDDSEEILLVGPSTAKLDFLRYVHKHEHALEPRIVGVETADHPTDGQLVAHAKKYFEISEPRL